MKLSDIKHIERAVLYRDLDELKKFETQKGVPLRQIPLGKMLQFRSGTGVETVGVDPSLIQQKVMDAVISGGEFVPLWNKVSRVVEMDAPKKEVPIIYYKDFKVYKGVTGAKVREAGGFFSNVELDCSNQNGLRRIKVAMDKTWIRDNNWSAVEEALQAAGQAMYDDILNSVLAELLTDVNTNMTDTVANWGNDHYKALVKMVSLIAAKRMYPDMIVVHPDELYDLFILDYFIHLNYATLAGRQAVSPSSGLAGYLFPNSIPIYFNAEMTAASMVCMASQKAAVLGVRQDLTVENFNNILDGEEGAVLTLQADVKSGKDATPTSNVIYAWAVATSA